MLWACEVIYFRAIYCAVYQVFEMGFQLNVLSYKAQSVVCVFKRKWQIKLTIFFFTLIHKEQRLFQLQTAARRFGMKHSPITNGCNDHVFMKLLPEQNRIYVFMFRLFFLSLNPQTRLWPVCILTRYLVENSLNDRSSTDHWSKTCVKTMYTYSITVKNATFKPLPK